MFTSMTPKVLKYTSLNPSRLTDCCSQSGLTVFGFFKKFSLED